MHRGKVSNFNDRILAFRMTDNTKQAPAGATGTTRVKGVVMLKFANPNDAARAAGIDEAEIMVEKVETKGK